jgi:glycosyltransferase involved in cell wall biosynthesis
MRILHISTRLILGGSQENTVLSCEGQARLGHDVHLAFGPIYGPEGSLLERVQAFRTAEGQGITTHVAPNLVREINPFKDLPCYHELKRLVTQLRPDIVHTHSSKAGILGRAAAWEADGSTFERTREVDGRLESVTIAGTRPGVVHTIHGPPFHKYQSNLLYKLYVESERYAAKRCHLIVSVANAMTRQYLGEGIGRAEQYVTVRSGMETEPFLVAKAGESREHMRREFGFADNDFVIGTVARLAELKGHDDLLDGLAEDLKRNQRWKLLWVGDGWWRERLLTKARGMGLNVAELDKAPSAGGTAPPLHHSTGAPPQVIITGLVPPERIPALMRAMDVLAHPSYREGLPRTVPQALLAGVCPVAYDVDGTGEACRHMQTGLLVTAGDKKALREAIGWCYSRPLERQRLAAAGQRECAQLFSAEKMVQDLEAVYARAVALRSTS